MNGGDTDTGGAKVNPSNTPSLTPQPDTNTASDAEAESILTISHDDHPASVGAQPTPQSTTAEPAVPPTPPVQSAPSTTVSTPTAQPAPSTMPVPPITDFPQSAPQAPQSVGQPVAPVVTPANQFASSTATALPPQPLTPPQFPQQPAQFPTQPIPASSGDVVLSSSTPKKSRKGLIIVLICLAILAIGAIIALVVFQSSHSGSPTSQQPGQNDTGPFTTKEEVYNALYDFDYKHYSDIISWYDHYIGLKPNIKMSEDTIIFPFKYGASSMDASMEKANQAYDDISSRIPSQLDNGKINIQPVKDAISKSLQALTTNIGIISDFYNAYISPLQENPRPTTCTKTSAMESLEQGRTSEAAQKYYTLYCQTVEFLAHSEDTEALQQSVHSLAEDALGSLNSILTDVPSAEKDISNILKELKQ